MLQYRCQAPCSKRCLAPEPMQFAAAIAESQDPTAAARHVVDDVTTQLAGQPCHLAFLFVSILYQTDWGSLCRQIRKDLGNPLLIGCTAGGVLGVDRELESTPAISLAAAWLPQVDLHPFTVSPEDLSEDRGTGFWIEKLGATPAEEPVGILLPEPFSCDVMTLVAILSDVYLGMPLIGGLASGGAQAGENILFFNEETFREGAVGVLLTGDVALQTIVSQGCRPIGRPFIITKADGNILLELAGLPATEALRQLLLTLSPQDQALARRALLFGVVMNEQQEAFRRGDFLIRNLIGMDPQTGALAVGDRVQVGQTVQFQLRDADTAREDLRELLKDHTPRLAQAPPAGALLFSCLGRGQDLYGEPHHDTRMIREGLGPIPLAGFFCNGEIGPVGQRNFVHGFTSSLGLFGPRSR